MRMQVHFRRAAGGLAALAVVVTAASGCSGSDADSSSVGGASAGTGSIADAEKQVTRFTANPALEISPVPKKPDTSTYAIQLNCSIPACSPGAMQPAMDALGWKFEVQTYDVNKGPVAEQEAFTQAIEKKPDVILVGLNFPVDTIQAQSEAAIAQGIKLIGVGGTETPDGYAACIQCTPSARALGALGGDVVLADAGGKTDVGVLFDKTVASLENEADGVKAEIAKNAEGSSVSDIEQSIAATPADNAATVVSFLQRNPNVKYLVLTSPQFDPSMVLKSAGLDQVKIVGLFPYSPVEVAAVEDGQVLAYAAGELGALYWRAVDAAVRAVQDAPIEPKEPVQSMRVMTKSNADVALLDPAGYQDVYLSAWHLK